MPDQQTPWASPADRQRPGWTPGAAYGPAPWEPSYGPPPPPPPVEIRVSTSPSGGRGTAVAGVVLGGLALLVALGTLAFCVITFLGVGGSGGFALRGTVGPQAGAVSGAALAEEVSTTVGDDGGEPADVVCPGTSRVGQGVTTVCHGTDGGDPATFVVLFEDAHGAYSLLEA